MPILVISKRHGRISYAICYAENPRPTFSLNTELARLPITAEEAALGLPELARRNPWPDATEGAAETATPAATAAQPATATGLLALPPHPGASALCELPTGSGAASSESDSWMWNLEEAPPAAR